MYSSPRPAWLLSADISTRCFSVCAAARGVATLIGVLLGFHWLLGAAFVITWLLAALLFRYSSLAAIIAALATPLYCWLLIAAAPYITAAGLMCAVLVWRHRSNMRNLLKGAEDRISFKR